MRLFWRKYSFLLGTCSKLNEELLIIETRPKNIKNIHVQLLFEGVTEGCSNHQAPNNNTYKIMVQLN